MSIHKLLITTIFAITFHGTSNAADFLTHKDACIRGNFVDSVWFHNADLIKDNSMKVYIDTIITDSAKNVDDMTVADCKAYLTELFGSNPATNIRLVSSKEKADFVLSFNLLSINAGSKFGRKLVSWGDNRPSARLAARACVKGKTDAVFEVSDYRSETGVAGLKDPGAKEYIKKAILESFTKIMKEFASRFVS